MGRVFNFAMRDPTCTVNGREQTNGNSLIGEAAARGIEDDGEVRRGHIFIHISITNSYGLLMD